MSRVVNPNVVSLYEYQREGMKTAKPSSRNLRYAALGLAGEAGEVANTVKKIYRDNRGVLTHEIREKLKKELGDCLWYIQDAATILDLSLKDIAQANLAKLKSRQERGMIEGSGDDR